MTNQRLDIIEVTDVYTCSTQHKADRYLSWKHKNSKVSMSRDTCNKLLLACM